MAARSPRKIFASSFVITVAAAACVESTPPPQGPQPTPAPAPAPDPSPVVVTNPPPPGPSQAGGSTQTYNFDQRWTVFKRPNGCEAMAKVECPKPTTPGGPVPTCNPPPPMKVACPDGWDGQDALTIVQYANQSTCMIEPPAMNCPKGATCNPPPPRKVACPTRP